MTRPACFFPEAEEKVSFPQHHSLASPTTCFPASYGRRRPPQAGVILGHVQSCYLAPPSRMHAQTDSWQSICMETEVTLGRSSALNSNTQDKQSNGGCVSCFFSVSWLQARETSHRCARIFSLESLLKLAQNPI